MILFNYIINNIDLELSNSEENISKIGFGSIMVFILEIKYC